MNNTLDVAVDRIMEEFARHRLDGYEVFATLNKGLTIEVKEGALDLFVASENEGISVRVVKESRPSFAFCTSLSSSALSELVKRVLEGVHTTDQDPNISFPVPGKRPSLSMRPYDENLAGISVEKKIDQARMLEAAALRYDPRIKKVRKAGYVETTGKVVIANHNGLLVDWEKTFLSGSILVVAEDGTDAEMGWDFGFSPFFEHLDMQTIGQNAASRAVEGLGARAVPSEKIQVVIPPQVACELLEVLSESFAADNVQKGKSMLMDEIGNPLFSNRISIIDDGLYEGGMATSPFDDEGSPHQTNVVVSKGVVEGFLYDQHSANKEGGRSTGNAGRTGIKGPPVVQPTNFYVKNGEKNPSAILASVKRGMFLADLMGIHTADPITGDFSVGAAGRWIENGEIAFPVKGVAIAGNILQILGDVTDVGNDLTFYGPFGSPTLLISEANISGSAT